MLEVRTRDHCVDAHGQGHAPPAPSPTPHDANPAYVARALARAASRYTWPAPGNGTRGAPGSAVGALSRLGARGGRVQMKFYHNP